MRSTRKGETIWGAYVRACPGEQKNSIQEGWKSREEQVEWMPAVEEGAEPSGPRL